MTILNDDMSFAQGLASVQKQLTHSLKNLMPEVHPLGERLSQAMHYASMAGGKRLRPFFVMASNHLWQGNEQSALRVAVAIEYIHCYSLVHDDLPAMDDDDMRRGHPSCHKQYDEATAILVGDALQSLAFEILADARTHEHAQLRMSLIESLAHHAGMRGMVGGQMADMQLQNEKCTFDDIAAMQRMKTGALLTCAITAGALLNGKTCEDESYQSLQNYAYHIGLAFQIQDDLLDACGDAARLGKKANKDKARGKATFVSVLGIEKAHDKAHQLVKQAQESLAPFGKKARLLQEAAHYIIVRDA